MNLEGQPVGVCGAGAMGLGIATIAAQAGQSVMIYDQSAKAIERAKISLSESFEKLIVRGKFTPDQATEIQERISWATDIKSLSSARLIVEAIIEDAAIKGSLFEELETVVPADTIIATNTSSLSVSSLAAYLQDPRRFVGLHFFNPAPVMKLVEIIPGRKTDPELPPALSVLMDRWGKIPVTARDVPGFIVNRVARPFYGEGWRAYEEGAATPATIDDLYRKAGHFRMGPLELGDLIGHDINHKAAASIFAAYSARTRFRPSILQGQLMASGDLGRKTGSGVFDYKSETIDQPERYDGDVSSIRKIRVSPQGSAILGLLKKSNVRYEEDQSVPPGTALLDNVCIQLSTGISARELAHQTGHECAVIDWPYDNETPALLGFSSSNTEAAKYGAAFIEKLGAEMVEIQDRPGGIVFRTRLQLANCAADALLDQVASDKEIDQALIYGVNYPIAPFAWAKQIGVSAAIGALENIHAETGDPIYLPSEGLRRILRDRKDD